MERHPSKQHLLSRRHFGQVVVGGSLIAGIDASSRPWAASAAGTPSLAGTLRTDEETLVAYAGDHGNLIHKRPRAVFSPSSVEDLASIVKYARRHGLRIAARGQGHQPFGQAQVNDGIVVDVSTLRSVDSVSGDQVVVDAGAEWGSVLSAALVAHRAPPVLPNYLELTVGGTLSIGGVGIATVRHGAQVDQVSELQVVTGTGDLVWCSDREQVDLFHAALAGQGQCGIVARVVQRLVAASPRVREYTFAYADLPTLLQDQRASLLSRRCDGLVAMIVATPNGWQYQLQTARMHAPPDVPNDAGFTAESAAASVQTRDLGYEEYMNTTLYVETPGAHVDVGLLIPEPAAVSFLNEALPRLNATDLGAALAMRVFVWDREVFTRPLFRLPDSERCVYVAILRAPATEPEAAARALAGNRSLFEAARRLGGTLYPFGALELTRRDWQRHYAEQWPALAHAKRRYDPSNVFASGPDLFARTG
ncbi:MAG TPA: FAD-binding protein [Polyangiales bacterium]|nr:FAD-binding protein [Polyangiales bacterium]